MLGIISLKSSGYAMMLPTAFTSFVVGGCFLLVVTFLPTEATPVPSTALDDSSSGTHPPTENDRERYNNLRAAILERDSKQILIQDLEINAHCPFKVLTVYNITRIVCDVFQIRNCTSNSAYCEDISNNCHQAYIKVGNSLPTISQTEKEKIEIGCIYHPNAIGIHVEADGASPERNVV
jgi:hypothetical protein